MKMRVVTAVGLLAALTACPGVAQGAKAVDPIGGDELTKLAERVESEANAWLKGEPVDNEATKKLAGVVYDDASVKVLKVLLENVQGKPVGVYVAEKLIGPLMRADPRVVKNAKDFILWVESRFARYKPLPRYKRGALRRFKYMDYHPGARSEAMLKSIAMIEKARDKKVAKEEPILIHNRQVGRLLEKIFRLELMLDDAKVDKQLMMRIVRAKKQRDATILSIFQAIRDRAASMSQEHAKRLHDNLWKLFEQWRLDEAALRWPDRPFISRHGNSQFYTGATIYYGIELPRTLNELAGPAKATKLPVPAYVEWREQVKKEREKIQQARKAGRPR